MATLTLAAAPPAPPLQSLASLAGQRSMFMDMTTKLGNLGAKFPVVNSLVSAIRRKKSKDTLILSAVVACCTLFLLAYWSRK
jgi:Golgi SNAP receptor complex protein 1